MRIPFGKSDAIACVAGGKAAPGICGAVKFYSMGKYVFVVADICGLPKKAGGIFALHIHEGKKCTGEDFAATGGHFNPEGCAHPFHAGDLPPLFACDGKAFLAVLTNRFSVQQILGRTVVIHSGADDFKTQPAGAAGEKIACGVIHRC